MSQEKHVRPELGICQWFHYEAYEDVERAVHLLRDLGIKHLRTGISWADYHRRRGPQWYDWQMAALGEFEVMPCIWHTPPSLAHGRSCSAPPHRLQDFADFIDVVIESYGRQFDALELWNEPNNRYKWDYKQFDPDWEQFAIMTAMAANWAQQRGKQTVLGGMIPVDRDWLELMKGYGLLRFIDVVAIHGFPNMWWPGRICWDRFETWHGWYHKVRSIEARADGRPVWITETGLATWEMASGRPGRYDMQRRMLDRAVWAPAGRMYWYSLIDLDPDRPAIEGFHVDENEYWMGLVSYDGVKKPAYHRMKQLVEATRRGALPMVSHGSELG
jgi:CDP-paratose 2-epimerase